MSAIPHSYVVVNSWKEATFEDTEEYSCCHKTRVLLDEALADHRHRPEYHDKSKPDARSEAFHHHVAGDFGGDVEREQNGETVVVLQAVESKILLEVVESGIPNVCTIQET